MPVKIHKNTFLTATAAQCRMEESHPPFLSSCNSEKTGCYWPDERETAFEVRTQKTFTRGMPLCDSTACSAGMENGQPGQYETEKSGLSPTFKAAELKKAKGLARIREFTLKRKQKSEDKKRRLAFGSGSVSKKQRRDQISRQLSEWRTKKETKAQEGKRQRHNELRNNPGSFLS